MGHTGLFTLPHQPAANPTQKEQTSGMGRWIKCRFHCMPDTLPEAAKTLAVVQSCGHLCGFEPSINITQRT